MEEFTLKQVVLNVVAFLSTIAAITLAAIYL